MNNESVVNPNQSIKFVEVSAYSTRIPQALLSVAKGIHLAPDGLLFPGIEDYPAAWEK